MCFVVERSTSINVLAFFCAHFPNVKCLCFVFRFFIHFYLTSTQFHTVWGILNWYTVFNTLHIQTTIFQKGVNYFIFQFRHTISNSHALKARAEHLLVLLAAVSQNLQCAFVTTLLFVYPMGDLGCTSIYLVYKTTCQPAFVNTQHHY